ncbi:SDR family NAD(P)-dependent oxidoreductase [Pseudomonadales bacterium]|jgi:NAD(P)-dependent dehydrogenase (short-subunit alcohol dehydrogenase family)|nr:SDR family NAD(P)-dependent oxidoreductase [Pseudomonadales bacterium]MDC1017657.1 SDR family NAD(P)-dependent oxidoreductase [Pseudomonadales bacterium]
MKELNGKVAFITGAGSGIGLSLARTCASEGMKVMLADVDDAALENAVASLGGDGIDCGRVHCDVTSPRSLQDAADATIERFGKIHLLVNNAGVLVIGGAGDNSLETWRWAMDVNVMGVIYGVEVFLPLIRSHGDGGHILNTASVGGHVTYGNMSAYCTTKHAVVGYTEALAAQLADEEIGVSALCPGFTQTHIAHTSRFEENREGDKSSELGFVEAVESGMSPDVVAKYAVEQIQQDALYIFTHPGTRGEVAERWQVIEKAFDTANASELINSDPDARRIASRDDGDELYQ